MKFALLAPLALALLTFAKTETVTYNTEYDSLVLQSEGIACSHFLTEHGWYTSGAIPAFPNIGGAATVKGLHSSECGSCWRLAYKDSAVDILVVDSAQEGFVLSEEAFRKLAPGEEEIDVQATRVHHSVCGI